jgi:glutamate/tyrosine decarboxylase-like PLP-dependent enzyme
MGGVDDFNAIADLAEKYDMWFHIDGCWGGFLVWCEEGRKIFKGCERATSISINPHKGFGVP